MKHIEVKNLKKVLDILGDYIIANKITNSYLNYGMIRNNRIVTKALEAIDEAVPKELKEVENKLYTEGVKAMELLTEEEKATIEAMEPEHKVNRIFNLGLGTAEDSDVQLRNKLIAEYEIFLNLESDIKLYYLNYEGVASVDMELQFWNLLDNFIKQE